MGYSIWVADDPELENDEEWGSEDPDFAERVERAKEHELAYPGFSTTNKAMSALVKEMQAQGMGRFIPLGAFSFCNGDHVPVEQISEGLAVAGELPVTATDDEMVELWQKWLAFLRASISHSGIVVY